MYCTVYMCEFVADVGTVYMYIRVCESVMLAVRLKNRYTKYTYRQKKR